jgi:hypothetical protein
LVVPEAVGFISGAINDAIADARGRGPLWNREAIAGIPVAFTETTDVLALFCWTFSDQLLAKINARIEELGDDNALDQTQREVREAELGAEILDIEGAECALIWAADARRETLDFRPDTNPMAVLAVGLAMKPAGPKGNVARAWIQHHPPRALMIKFAAVMIWSSPNWPVGRSGCHGPWHHLDQGATATVTTTRRATRPRRGSADTRYCSSGPVN